MYSKKNTKKVVEEYRELFIDCLGMSKYILNIYVCKSGSKEISKYRLKAASKKLAGVSFVSKTGDSDIILFYDNLENKKQCILTLLHELLHVRISKCTGLVTLNADKCHNEEEKFILDLEKLFGALL